MATAAAVTCFRFLRRPMRAIIPSPPAKRGSAAGSGAARGFRNRRRTTTRTTKPSQVNAVIVICISQVVNPETGEAIAELQAAAYAVVAATNIGRGAAPFLVVRKRRAIRTLSQSGGTVENRCPTSPKSGSGSIKSGYRTAPRDREVAGNFFISERRFLLNHYKISGCRCRGRK